MSKNSRASHVARSTAPARIHATSTLPPYGFLVDNGQEAICPKLTYSLNGSPEPFRIILASVASKAMRSSHCSMSSMASIVTLSLALRMRRSRSTLTIDLLHCEPTKAHRTILKNVAESSSIRLRITDRQCAMRPYMYSSQSTGCRGSPGDVRSWP